MNKSGNDTIFLNNYNYEEFETNNKNRNKKHSYENYNSNETINLKIKNSSSKSISINNISKNISKKNSRTKISPLNTHREITNNRNIFFSDMKNINRSINVRKNMTSQNSRKNIINNSKNKNIFLLNIKLKQIKSQRYIKDKKNNYDIYKMSKDQYNKIKEISKNLLSDNFYNCFFSNDLKNNISAYQNMIDNLSKKENIHKFCDNLDIILKLIGYGLINTSNNSLIKIIFDFLDSLYITVVKYDYKLNDIEYNIIFSMLIEKLCINNNLLKEKIIYLINRYIYLINADEIVPILLNNSIDKNNSIKLEILDIVINLYKSQDMNKYSKIYISSLYNFYLSNKDKIIKDKCIFLFKKIYSIYGNNLWDIIHFEEKIKNLIEENKVNNININNGRNSFMQLNKNNSYKEQKTQNDNINGNGINKSENNKIFYNTSINFNPNNKHKDNLEYFDSNEKSFYNKIKVKKIDTMKNTRLMSLKKKKNSNNLNNSFNSSYYKNYSYNYNSEDIYRDIYNYNNNNLTKDEIISKMNNLLSDNYLIKINSIIILHEIFCLKYEENKIIILNNIEQIIDIFLKVIKDLFLYIPNNLENNFNKFAKYTVTTLCKLLSNKELIVNISYKTIYTLSEEIINFLLNNEDLIEENEKSQEKNIIFKSLNSSMMRILDNYNTTSILLILLELITNYYNKNIKNYNLFILTILKCLEKKIQNFDKIISDIETDAILLQIHLLLNKINQFLPELNSKNEIDIKIITFIKKFLCDMVEYKKEKILEDYNKSVNCHFIKDKYMIKWIHEYIFKNKEKEIKGNIFKIKLNNRKKNNKNNFANSYIGKIDKKISTSFSNKNLGKFK